ncbi:MAG: hypothetical protein H0T79_20890 [Deltaproteobacteria bacterium]|nr:hypothetical protein [Deltaproteobacteria bacterium]
MFEWTDDLAALTPPFRGDGNPIKRKKLDAAAFLAPVATSLASHVAPDYQPRASLVTLASTGKGSFADEADALIILGSTGLKGPFKGQLTVVPDADKLKIVNQGVDRWVELYGTSGALEIFALVGAWTPYPLLTVTPTMVLAMDRLRAHLAHASDYDAARATAERLASTLPTAMTQWTQTYSGKHGGFEVLAYLFPDHHPFFDAAVTHVDTLPEARFGHLLGCVTSVADVERITDRTSWHRYALVVVRSLREAALPYLLAAAKTEPDSTGIATALTAFGSASAAAALASLGKPAKKIVAAYFAKHPTLATK